MKLEQSFQSTDSYIATDELRLAVNAALSLQRPLLIKGEPGTGKTMLAEEVAKFLSAHYCSGILNQPPRPNRVYMNMMRYLVCATHNWVMSALRILLITFVQVCCGKLLNLSHQRLY